MEVLARIQLQLNTPHCALREIHLRGTGAGHTVCPFFVYPQNGSGQIERSVERWMLEKSIQSPEKQNALQA